MSETMTAIQRIEKFFQKSPQQMWETARFLGTMWLSKLSYAPHKVRLQVTAEESVTFWWSYFPASFSPHRSVFEYWGEDVGDLRFLWKYLRQGMTFLDIGAYHGVYSIVAAKKLGDTGRVVAFEPSSRERKRMLVNLTYNKIETVTIEPYAVAADEDEALLTVVVDGFTTMNSLRLPPIDHPTEQVTVSTISLDAYLDRKKIDRVDLLKIDTEGGELEAFRGADKLVSNYRPVIICEVLDLVTHAWGYAAAEIIGLLRAHDYEWFDILSDGSLIHHCAKEEYPEGRNYLAVPREKQGTLPLKIQS